MSPSSASTTSRGRPSTIPASPPSASPSLQMGIVAARILLQRIRGQATFPDVVPIHPELVIRESTCPPNPRRTRGKRELKLDSHAPDTQPRSHARAAASGLRSHRRPARHRRPAAAFACFHVSSERQPIGPDLSALLCRHLPWRAPLPLELRPRHGPRLRLCRRGLSPCCHGGMAFAAAGLFPARRRRRRAHVGVSLFVGRAFPQMRASMLTFLNFTWSAGALVAPLLASRILLHHSYRFAYTSLAFAAALAAPCALWFRDPPEAAPASHAVNSIANLRLIAVFALAAFLEVGVENTAATWLSTYAMRTAHRGAVLAAASTSLYWAGFLASRGLLPCCFCARSPRVFRCSAALAIISGPPGSRPFARPAQCRHVRPRRRPRAHLPTSLIAFLRARPAHVRFALGPGDSRIWRVGSAVARRLGIRRHRRHARGDSRHSCLHAAHASFSLGRAGR